MCVRGTEPAQSGPVIVYVVNYWRVEGVFSPPWLREESTEPTWE